MKLLLAILILFISCSCALPRPVVQSKPEIPVSEKIRLCVKEYVEYSGINPETAAAICKDIYRR